ncbi:hypothetical protein V6768_18510 [Tistrella mobilis]
MVNQSTAIMTIDFGNAHDRHWNDAETLRENGRLANADHLYGFSAECGLKALMQSFGMSVHDGEPADRRDWKHVDQLAERYETYRSGSTYPNAASYMLVNGNAFNDWRASQRYAVESAFTQDRVDAHATGAREVRDLVKAARREGLL